MAPAPRIGVNPGRAGLGRCTAASARAPGPAGRGIHGPRTRGLLRSVQPRGGGGNRGHVTARRVPRRRALPRLRRSQPARARARTRPHVSLRPRGMWVTEPSGLTCPRPPPPPQRPLCNAASRAGPANPRPRAAERKHSAHVARAAGPCEGGAGPAPPGRAAVMQGTGRATAGPPGGRRGPSPWQIRSAEQPTPPALGTLPAAVPPPCPGGSERPLRRPQPAAVWLLPAFTSMVPSGRGPRPSAFHRAGSAATASAPRRPGLEAAIVAGPPHGQGGRGARDPRPDSGLQ